MTLPTTTDYRDQAEQLLAGHLRTWTIKQLAHELGCSVDTAGVVLRGMLNVGTANRQWVCGSYAYWSTAHGAPGDR